MKKALLSIALAATLLGGSLTASYAGGMMGGFNGGFGMQAPGRNFAPRGGGCGYGFQYMQRELNLTPEQIQQINKLRQEQFENFAKNQTNFKMSMFDATKSGNFNKQLFINESLQNAKIRTQLKAENMERFLNILTPQQRQKFAELQKQHMQFAIKNMEQRQQFMQERLNYLKSDVQ